MKVLTKEQVSALNRMHDGCILCGDTGTGKSLVGLSYFWREYGGKTNPFHPIKEGVTLYIITTARKRDTFEWEGELTNFLYYPDKDGKNTGKYDLTVHIDSWNNIKKYANVKNAFFIFDEQRVVGDGVWSKSFIKIAKNNRWILLSATPGDTWSDYMSVFIANGYYETKTQFKTEHIIWKPYMKYPAIDRYINIGRLVRLRDKTLVTMVSAKETTQHHIDLYSEYDRILYKNTIKDRWNYEKQEPIKTSSELCYTLRKICNSDISRHDLLKKTILSHNKVIVFYNFDYELEIIKLISKELKNYSFSEWNGHAHNDIPETEKWIYAVQYNAGAEGWNCIKTDTIIFYSQNYSYKMMHQSAGRIDRLNTKFTDLYYYHLKTHSSIDLSIATALRNKKKFNEGTFARFT